MASSTDKYQIEMLSEHISMLAEAPIWSDKQQKLIYVDCFRKELCLLDSKTKLSERKLLRIEALAPDLDFISAAIPYASASKLETKYLIVAMDKLYQYNSDAGEIQQVYKDSSTMRRTFNDGKCDRRGRLWVGCLKFDELKDIKIDNEEGNLQCIGGTYQMKVYDDKYLLPNGLAWSPDYKKLFWADFSKRIIWAYDFDEDTMSLRNKRTLIDFNAVLEYKESGGFPDGLTTDLYGHLYVACWEGGRIAKICCNTGEILDTIKMPITKVTSLCIGGADYTELLVTSASVGLDQVDVGIPNSGKIFRITCSADPKFKGFAQNCFVEGP